MKNLPFHPLFQVAMPHRRSKSFRRFSTAVMVLLMTLVVYAAAAAGPGQIASLEVSRFGSSSEDFDFGALETKIRNTDAIDLFSKISLKYEISSLIDEMARSHETKNAAGFTKQRERFEKLVDRTVIMLRKGDISFAKEVEDSREALWQILNSPEKLLAIANLNGDRQDD